MFALLAQCALSVEQPETSADLNAPGSDAPPEQAPDDAESKAGSADPDPEKGTLHEVSPEELAKAGQASAKAKEEREKEAEERRAFREAKAQKEAEEEAAREAELSKIPVRFSLGRQSSHRIEMTFGFFDCR